MGKGPELTQSYLHWIGLLVIGQLYVICFLAVLTLALLKWRTWKNQRILVLKEAYGESIADVVCGEDQTLFVPALRPFQFIRRQALKESLLDNIGSITGPERAVLVEAYITLGLAATDVKACHSRFWPTRLAGLMSLSQLGRADFADLFHSMKNDKNTLISSCAILSLSYLDDQNEEPEKILDTLPESFFKNSNLLFELTNNFMKRYGLERFEAYVRDRAQSLVGQAIIAVLTNSQTPEATFFLLELVTTNNFKDERLVIRIERAIRESNDIDAIAQLDYFQTARGSKRYGAAA